MTCDPWCVTVDMGQFDLIVHESGHYQSVQSYADNCRQLYNQPLVIMLHSQVRKLIEDWQTIEVCTGCSVVEPEKTIDIIKS